jgi:ABC transporter DrrB family efflux protein
MTWAIKDTWTLTFRALAHWRRSPGPALIALLFPVLVVLMFGSLFGGQMDVPGGDYFAFLMPGMFALAMLFGLESTMTAVTVDASRGVTGRLRSMPIAAGAVVAGRAVADVLHSAAGLAVLVACGLLVGWRVEGSAGDALLAVALLLWLRVALVWVGIHLGLVLRDPQAVVAVQILVWPVGFLSSAFVDPATMPDWLGTIAALNPVSAAATAARDLLGNPAITDGSWATEHAVLLAILWPLVLTAVCAPLAVRRYQRLGD